MITVTIIRTLFSFDFIFSGNQVILMVSWDTNVATYSNSTSLVKTSFFIEVQVYLVEIFSFEPCHNYFRITNETIMLRKLMIEINY